MPVEPQVTDRRILVTGARGRLGRQLVRRFPDALAPSRQELDLTWSVDRMAGYLASRQPTIVIHAAALANIRQCEESRPLAWATNVAGTANLLRACAQAVPDVYIVYVSTACVFDGERGAYIESDIPDPHNFYGLTKLAGELIVATHARHLIARTNFVAREPWPYPRAFVDRFGSYLYAEDVAGAIADMIDSGLTGVAHIAGDERLSMYALARLTTPDVLPTTLSDYEGPPLTRDMTLDSTRWKKYRLSHRERETEREPRS
jgi:dTDP-4-dehydrorhamnose reductase